MGSESSGSQSFFANMAVDVEQFPGGARGVKLVSLLTRLNDVALRVLYRMSTSDDEMAKSRAELLAWAGRQLKGGSRRKKGQKIVSIEEIFEASVAKMQRLSQCDGQMLPDFPKVRLHFCDHCIAESHHFCLEM